MSIWQNMVPRGPVNSGCGLPKDVDLVHLGNWGFNVCITWTCPAKVAGGAEVSSILVHWDQATYSDFGCLCPERALFPISTKAQHRLEKSTFNHSPQKTDGSRISHGRKGQRFWEDHTTLDSTSPYYRRSHYFFFSFETMMPQPIICPFFAK